MIPNLISNKTMRIHLHLNDYKTCQEIVTLQKSNIGYYDIPVNR